MKKILASALVLVMSGIVALAQPPQFKMPKMPEENHTLTVGNLTMTINAAYGARITSFKYGDQEIISQIPFPLASGSTFWTSPQAEWNWPPVREHDSLPYTVEEKDGHLVMTSQLSSAIPMRIIKDFSADKKKEAFVVSYTLVNEGDVERSVAPWEITRVPGSGLIFFDAPVEDITPAGLLNFTSKKGLAWYAFDEASENRKVNADGKGWYAFTDNGLLMIKEFEDLDPSQPAPAEAEVQVYVNQGKSWIELECQGAYVSLKPGESLTWTVKWYLMPLNGEAEPSGKLAKQVKKALR